MQQGYLLKHKKNTRMHLPYLNPHTSKQTKNSVQQIHRLRQPTQQSLLLQIQDIDNALNSKTLNYRNGNLFSTQITDRLINQFHLAIKKSMFILQDGFNLLNMHQMEANNQQPNGQANGQDTANRLTHKLETLNQKMAKLSLKNVYDYDLQKYMQIMKINKSRWSLFKRNQEHEHNKMLQKQAESRNTSSKYTEQSPKMLNNKKFSNQSISVNTSLKQSPKQNSQQTTLSPLSKLSKILQTHNQSRVQDSKQSHNVSRFNDHKQKSKFKRNVLTEISEQTNPQDDTPQISKYDIKKMLKKQDHLISVWLPPSTYPQFNGLFVYGINTKNSICRLKKYFFFKRNFNERFINSIIEEISTRQNMYVEGVEIITNKNDYNKIYQPIGWKMRAVEGIDKLRIRFTRQKL